MCITDYYTAIPTYILISSRTGNTVFIVWLQASPTEQYRHNTVVRLVQLPSKSFLILHLPVILTQQLYSLGYWQRDEITKHDTPIGVPFTYRGRNFTFLRTVGIMGQDSSVGTVTRYRQDGPRIESRWGRDFPHLSRPALGPTQPPIQWVPALSRG